MLTDIKTSLEVCNTAQYCDCRRKACQHYITTIKNNKTKPKYIIKPPTPPIVCSFPCSRYGHITKNMKMKYIIAIKDATLDGQMKIYKEKSQMHREQRD